MGDKKRKLVQNEAEKLIEPEGKKAKKEKKDKKIKKEKRKSDAHDVPSVETVAVQDEVKKKEKKEKKEKKRKQDGVEGEEGEAAPVNMDVDIESIGKPDGGKKREKKEKKKQKKESKQEENTAAAVPQDESADKSAETSNDTTQDQEAQKNARFIVFVGNLPYSANTESVKKHFEKNPPANVRVATQKDDPRKRCRGFAFIEFDNYDRLKTCLKLYHHSTFDDGQYPPRRINVELTAGGGGKSDHRKAKIEAKNERLNNERQRGATQIQKEKKKHDNKPAQQSNGGTGADAVSVHHDDQFADVHPSRRQRMV